MLSGGAQVSLIDSSLHTSSDDHYVILESVTLFGRPRRSQDTFRVLGLKTNRNLTINVQSTGTTSFVVQTVQ